MTDKEQTRYITVRSLTQEEANAAFAAAQAHARSARRLSVTGVVEGKSPVQPRTVKAELHHLIDRLSDDDAAEVLEHVRALVGKQS